MMKPAPPEVAQTTVETMDMTNGKRKSKPLMVNTQDKKQFTGHGCRRTKKQLRIDFANAKTSAQAQTLWYEVMTILRNIDTTMLIHNQKTYDKTIASQEKLPEPQELSQYTCIVENTQKRYQSKSFSSITTITTSRPVYEFKRIEPTFVQQLQELGVYLRSTNLSTVDTMETGMFLGLHPSLTNVEWRTKQINEKLGYNNTIPTFKLYRRRLKFDKVSTNTIVLRCAREDQEKLENQLLNLKLDELGDAVEFIPYKMMQQMSLPEKKNIYYIQNQHIAEHGACAFQGVPEEVMLEKVKDDTTLLEWLQSHEHIVQVKKSGTPGIQKWWMITKLENKQELEIYMDTTVKDNLSKFHPTRHQYMSPKQIRTKHTISEPNLVQNTYLQNLQDRLRNRTKTINPI